MKSGLAILGCLTVVASAQVIPTNRTFTAAWLNAGHPGPIVLPAKVVNVRDFGSLGTGTTNDLPAITAAIRSLSNAPGVVFFPAGAYRLQATLNVPAGVVLRGESPTNTLLRIDHLRHGISISGGPQTGKFQRVLAGYSLHSNSITVSNGSEFAAGDYAELQQNNDPSWRVSGWAQKTCGQFVRITAVAGNTLTLERPLRIGYRDDLLPEIRKVNLVTGAGVENLKLERLAAGTNPQRDNIYTISLAYAARCWVRGVESANTFGGHVALDWSTQCEVTGSYFHHAWDYDGGGSGYGVRLQYKSGECKVENNIFQHLRHSIVAQAGVNGNVVAYNYSREPLRTEFPSEVSSDITIHGNYPYANLFEGNIVQHIQLDSSHGANGPLNTFFRNRAEAYGLNVTDRTASNQNVVGNETFTVAFAPFLGDGYSLKGPGNFEFGNLTKARGLQPPGTTNLTDVSYYLTNLPAFWTITNSWPTIGPPHSLDPAKEIPARTRYFAGTNLTVTPRWPR
ncbi:MAG: hypothetical protein PCFJNLEI_02463 [Verrucomicrobiae bacterium]|nr:hypothetical protein [Verrucomicrobiae bacterium]